MIIGIDASRANHEQKTGVEWYAFFVIQELKKILPADVHVVLYSEVPLQGELGKLPQNWSSKVLRWLPKRLWTQLRLSLEMLLHAPDVLFIPAHVFPIIHPKKTVMTVHDVAAVRFPRSYNWFERWYSVWSAKYAVHKLWRVIVPSEFTKAELISSFTRVSPLSQNISVVHHGFDSKFKEKISETEITRVLKKYQIQKPFILSIGRLEEKKNTLRMVQAFEMFKNWYHPHDFQLVLLGKLGYGGEKVEKAVATSHFQQDIVRPGYVEQADIPALFQAAEVFLFPSLYEGFGIPVLEAFASGTPVITSQNTSTQEIAADAALLVHPEDTKNMVDALQDLITHPDRKQTLIEKGKQRAEDFSWQKCAEETALLLLKK